METTTNTTVTPVTSKPTFEEMNELVGNKALELTKQVGQEVIPLLFDAGENWCIGYFKAPTRMQIMSILGKGGQDPLFSGESLLQQNLIKEISDKRLLNDSPAFDEINIGAFLAAYASANKMSVNLAEKKTGK